MTVFVDTSVWYAAADADDAGHLPAARLLVEWQGKLLTSDHVLVETWYLADSRLGRTTAETLIEGIRSGIASVAITDASDLARAAEIGREFPDQDFSIVDRTSWSVMHRLGIEEALSFDQDYAIYRYGPGRRKALTVHR